MYIRMVVGILFSASTSHVHAAVLHTPMGIFDFIASVTKLGAGIVALGALLLIGAMVFMMLVVMTQDRRENVGR